MHKASGRFFSATQQQAKQVRGHCHYMSLGAVGIADTSIFQLVLSTNSQGQHGIVQLQGMRRNPCRSKAILCLVFCQRPNVFQKTKLWHSQCAKHQLKRGFDAYTQHLKPDVQHKAPSNLPRLSWTCYFLSEWFH